MLAKPQAESPPAMAPLGVGNLGDALPEPGHVARGEHAQGEDEAADIAAQEGFVEDLLAAHGLDGEDVAAGPGAVGKGAMHRLPEGAVAELRRPLLVAQVHDGRAQSAGQAGGFVRLLQELAEDGGYLGPPLGTAGHGRQVLELQDDARHLKGVGPLEDAFRHLAVLGEDVRPGGVGDGDGREGEVDFGEDGAGA